MPNQPCKSQEPISLIIASLYMQFHSEWGYKA